MTRVAIKRSKVRREGAAMLIVLMVLIMTTATATFAMHSTSIEIRSAGHARQAVQAEYLAEGAVYAGVSQLDRRGPGVSLVEYLQTNVTAGTASTLGEATIDRNTNLWRVRPEDLTRGASGIAGPSLETAGTPSLGPHSAYQATFFVDGSDLFQLARDRAGADLTGRGAHFYRMTLTSLGQMAPPSDYRAADDPRSYNEVASRARAYTEVGPFWVGGH